MSEQAVQERLAVEAQAEEQVDAPAVEETVVEGEQADQAEKAEEFTDEDREAMNKALRAERKRARELEKQVKEFQAKVEASEQADLGEQEKALAEAVAAARAEAKAEYDAQVLKLRVEAKAAGMNFHDPALALSLLEVDADADDDELVDALKALAEDRPYLVKAAKPDVGAGPRPGKGGSMQSMSDENWFRDFITRK